MLARSMVTLFHNELILYNKCEFGDYTSKITTTSPQGQMLVNIVAVDALVPN